MSFIRSSKKIIENKKLNFKVDIENESYMKKKIYNLFKNEFEETLPDILLIKGVQFIDHVKNGVLLVLENTYTDQCLTNDTLKTFIENGLNEVKNQYKNSYSLLSESWEEYERNTKKRIGDNKFEILINFRKHCFGSEDFASHNCQHKQNRFIIIKDKKGDKKYVICQACQKVYYTSFIKCRCKKCNLDFYSNLLKDDEDSNLLPATWEKYHCPQIVNEEMKCIKCNELFLINMKTGNLCCSNRNCNFTINPMKILWLCIQCGKEFKSKAIPYNPLEIILLRKVVRQTLLLKHRAHPNKLPCCDLNVYITDFYHKKICRGILFEGELNDKMIIVCEKCKVMNFHERFLWTCPNCGKKFRDVINKLTEDQNENNNKRGIVPDIQKEYIIKKENKEEMWNKYKKSSLKAVIDSPIKKPKDYKGVYPMKLDRKENYEEDVLANFKLNQKNSGQTSQVDKYEGNDIYEDKVNKNVNKNVKFEIKPPNSPYRSPRKISENSPNESPNKKIYISPSPKKGILKNKINSPFKSPIKSPKKVVIIEEKKNDKDDDITIDNDDDSIIDFEDDDDEEEELNNNDKNNQINRSIKKSMKRSIKEKTIGKEINDKDREKEEEKIRNTFLQMNQISGISDNLLNHINKKMNQILSKLEIPLINIDDYTFYRKLGEGSYGIIFSAINNMDNKKYAIKKIIARTINEIESFTKEFELVYKCDHPNIMKIYGISIRILDSTTYSLYVLMEIAKSDWDREIKRRLQKRQKYTEIELITIIKDLSDALLYIQTKFKLSHRDIKPQNILVFENGLYKLADFGEAKEVKVSKRLNTLRGTELYMSPALYEGLKQGKNNVNHDPFKSDVFSLGFCLLYASSLNFELLYEARDNDSSNNINRILNKSLIKRFYSEKLICILYNMLLFEEKERFNFEELIKFIKDNYSK